MTTEAIIIPQGDSIEDIKIREQIIFKLLGSDKQCVLTANYQYAHIAHGVSNEEFVAKNNLELSDTVINATH